jgi:glycosyltransferase involved in cell wall biosynthesis
MSPLDSAAPPINGRSSRLNVCVIGLRGVPGVLGGVESHCEQLLPRLQALSPDYQISVVGRHPYLPAEQFDYKGVTVVPLPAMRSKYFEAISNTALAVLYARFSRHARLLHIHNIGPALFGPMARLLGMKLIVTYHSRNYEHAKWNRIARTILRLGERCTVAAAHKVIVISRSMTDDLKRRYPRAAAKFVFVPNGATEFPEPADGDEERALLDRFGLERGRYILAVGRLVPEKSFHTLIEAFKPAYVDFKQGADCKLAIAGKADHEDAYSRAVLAEADDRVCFTGFQGQRELGILYRNASLFVLPSTHEGLPLAALEAASLGVPVLLSDIQPNLDIDLPAECYFPVGDVEALRRKILQPHETYRIDHEGIARRFDWSLVARQTKDIYADVCAAG